MNKKVVLVTGATRGIGAAILKKFLSHKDYFVVGTATSESGVETIKKNIAELNGEGLALQLDVCNKEAISNVINTIQEASNSGVDILINNAGITRDNLLLRMSDEDWSDVLNTNLTSVYFISKKVIKSMMKSRWGRIINIGSVSGVMGNAGQVNYAAAKAGMVAFSKSLAKEVASRGITVNTVAPGFVQTDMTDSLTDKQKEELFSYIPMKRFALPNEVAESVYFLSTNAASYITGETLHVNGGMYM